MGARKKIAPVCERLQSNNLPVNTPLRLRGEAEQHAADHLAGRCARARVANMESVDPPTISRDARQQAGVTNEHGAAERFLQGALFRGPDGVSLAAIRPIAPVSYSRRVALLKFDASLPSRRMTVLGSTTQLGERVSMTRSPFLEFSQTVVSILGALAGRTLIVNPSSTYLAACPSGVKLERVSA